MSITLAPSIRPAPEEARASLEAAQQAPVAASADQLLRLLRTAGLVSDAQLRHAARVQAKLQTAQSLLKTLQDLGVASMDDIRQVIRANPTQVALGPLLVELGFVREGDLRAVFATQGEGKDGRRLEVCLVENHLLSETRLVELISDLYGFPLVEPRIATIDRSLLGKQLVRTCLEHGFIPISRQDGKVAVAFAYPLDERHRAAAQGIFGGEVVPAIARATLVRDALEACERGTQTLATNVDEHTAIALVNGLIREAIRIGASDIHIEPLKSTVRVRFRLDGVMIEHKEIGREFAPSVISRLKILATADIAEKRRHQDGRIHYEDDATGDVADIRASFFVTIHGEKVVLRLLNRKAELISIDDIGMGPRMLDRFRYDALDVPTGVVIITGPTGSGKTTTLYSCVDYLNKPDTSIITAEDPVEYMIDGISQCSINNKINLTFEETLRHIVRQDPDVIVLGEIRDRFSADTAIQAALTGHKVLTTFHTEDSIGGLLRLLNMDIEAFLISSTVVSVVAQRLLRRVCPHCRQPHIPTPIELRRLGLGVEDVRGAEFHMGRGCEACRFTGYRGRVCVFELLVLNEMVKDAILNRKTSYEIRRISVETSGLVTLLEDGIHKAALGQTSIDEVLRNLPRVTRPRPLNEVRRLLGAH